MPRKARPKTPTAAIRLAPTYADTHSNRPLLVKEAIGAKDC
jgi:hypothetical protein